MRLATVILSCVLLLAACTGGSPVPSGITTSPPTASVPANAPASPTPGASTPGPSKRSCPNPEVGDGNDCLGPVAAGTYTTRRFTPTLTYTVPDGWANLEDMAGNFLLLPPGADLAGVNAGTSDYLGVYTWVVAPEHCTGRYEPMVKETFDGLLGWLKGDLAIRLSNVHDVTVGGLEGVAMDIAQKVPTGDGCSDGTYADVYVGAFPTSLVHAVDTDYPMRVFLLRNGDKALAVELADAPNGGSDFADWFAAAEPVVEGLVFGGS